MYVDWNHLGNVRVVINQSKTSTGNADVVYYSDYYPYGSPMTLASNDYRHGYQGQFAEADEETGWNNFQLRMYDPVIGRWMSTDPYGQYASPYLGMGNNPINGVDEDGGFWQELGNWLTKGMWMSNKGIDYLRNTPNASYVGWSGNRLTGSAVVRSYDNTPNNTSKLNAVTITHFKGVQDYTFNGVDIYLDFDFKLSAGLRAAMLAEGLAGVDVNIGSVELLNFNFINNKWSNISDGYIKYSTGFSASIAGVGGSFEASFKQVDGKTQEAILEAGAGFGGVNFKGAVDLAQSKLRGTLSYSNLKYGIGVVAEISPKLVMKQHNAFH